MVEIPCVVGCGMEGHVTYIQFTIYNPSTVTLKNEAILEKSGEPIIQISYFVENVVHFKSKMLMTVSIEAWFAR